MWLDICITVIKDNAKSLTVNEKINVIRCFGLEQLLHLMKPDVALTNLNNFLCRD